MATIQSFTITKAGRAMLASAMTDDNYIEFTSLKSSAEDLTGKDLESLTSITTMQGFPMMDREVISDTTVKVTANITNAGAVSKYELKAVALYAKSSSGGEEVLFAVAPCASPYETLDPTASTRTNIEVNFYMDTSNSKLVVCHIDMETYVTKGQCIDIAHPVGIVIFTDGSFNPADKWGGTWQKIENSYIMASGTYNGTACAAMGTGGNETYSLSESQNAPHSHTRGTMEITGGFPADDSQVGRHAGYHVPDGAFYVGEGQSLDFDSHSNGDGAMIRFAASRTWSGATSVSGKGDPFPIMPKFTALDVWRRTA